MATKDLEQYRLVDIDQGNFLKGIQAEFNKAAKECVKRHASTSVKIEIKLVPDREEASIVKILCTYEAKLPALTAGDQGEIVDGVICTASPVTAERIEEVLDFTGETKLKLAK